MLRRASYPIRVVLLAAGLAGNARAYCRAHACDGPYARASCAYDADGCPKTGPELHWPSNCVSFGVLESGSPRRGVTRATAAEALAHAFELWRSADCGHGKHPNFRAVDLGAVACGVHEFNEGSANANALVFHDVSWPYDSALAAVTSQRWNPDTGEILDSDLELNTEDYDFEPGAYEARHVPLLGLIAHETGHFLGLTHTRVKGSLMLENYEPSSTPVLGADDVRGVCALFPPGKAAADERCEPRNGFSPNCGGVAGVAPASMPAAVGEQMVAPVRTSEGVRGTGVAPVAEARAPVGDTKGKEPRRMPLLAAAIAAIASVSAATWVARRVRGKR